MSDKHGPSLENYIIKILQGSSELNMGEIWKLVQANGYKTKLSDGGRLLSMMLHKLEKEKKIVKIASTDQHRWKIC